MPHLKCVACKVRLRSPGALDDVVCDLCPECGAVLERVRQLEEIVGFREFQVATDSRHKRLVERLGDMATRRRVREDQAEALESWRWLDDDGSFDPASVSAALAQIALPANPTRGDRRRADGPYSTGDTA